MASVRADACDSLGSVREIIIQPRCARGGFTDCDHPRLSFVRMRFFAPAIRSRVRVCIFVLNSVQWKRYIRTYSIVRPTGLHRVSKRTSTPTECSATAARRALLRDRAMHREEPRSLLKRCCYETNFRFFLYVCVRGRMH